MVTNASILEKIDVVHRSSTESLLMRTAKLFGHILCRYDAIKNFRKKWITYDHGANYQIDEQMFFRNSPVVTTDDNYETVVLTMIPLK